MFVRCSGTSMGTRRDMSDYTLRLNAEIALGRKRQKRPSARESECNFLTRRAGELRV